MIKTHDIIISGASFAGLAAAAALRQELGGDVRIAIVDRAMGIGSAASPAGTRDVRAFAIWAAARHMLTALGVWPAIADDAQVMRTIEITDSALNDGFRPALLTYDAITADGEPAAHMVPAETLQRALYERVAGDGNIAWIAPAEAISLTERGHAIDIALQDGRALSADLVIAAEGRASKLRDAAGIKTVGWGYGQTGIVATIELDEPHGGVAIQHFLPGGPFAVLPLKGNRVCITWSAAREEADRVLALSDTAFLDEIERRVGGRFGALRLVHARQSWPLDLKLARQLWAPRFALVGDAAHGVHPIAGQGVNLALRDVAALVESIADAARLGYDFGHAPALERYARWRRFDTTMSAAAFDGLNQLFSVDNMILRAGRGVGLGLIDGSAAVKRMIVEEAAGLTGDLPRLLRPPAAAA
ncbi:MAG: FAD-dependent monooxygenase [Hyphomicrobium sp.]